ncbi:MAG: putative sulfate exporter family transporter [Candidatus Omnitrophota bacterium]|nr:putative sulfate exporter family transporter [Candidatus Omnitrophota bacterium]
MGKEKGLFALALPGFLLALGISIFSYWLSGLYKFINAFAVAVIIGVIIGSCFPRKNSLWIGTALCKDILLPVGLFLYGTEINFKKIALCCVIGSDILFQCVIYSALTFLIVYFLNKLLKVTYKTNLLTSVGSAICGVAAIAVSSPMVDAEEEDVTKALISILLVGVVSFFASVFFLNKLFFAADVYGEKFAIFCGLTFNQDGLVQTAGTFMEKGLDKLALNVKYIRTTLILPFSFIVLFLNQLKSKKATAEIRLSVIKYSLTIAYLFFGAALLFTYTPLEQYSPLIKPWYKIIFGAALAAIGLTCDIRRVLKKEAALSILSALAGWIIVVAIFIILMNVFPSLFFVNPA